MTNEEIKDKPGYYWFKPIRNHPDIPVDFGEYNYSFGKPKWHLVKYSNWPHRDNVCFPDIYFENTELSLALHNCIGKFIPIDPPND